MESWTEATTRRSPSSATRWSRKAIASGKLWPVSTCMTGKGKRPGRKAFSARRSRTAESLPPENSSTGRSNSAAASRMMKIASASSESRWVRRAVAPRRWRSRRGALVGEECHETKDLHRGLLLWEPGEVLAQRDDLADHDRGREATPAAATRAAMFSRVPSTVRWSGGCRPDDRDRRLGGAARPARSRPRSRQVGRAPSGRPASCRGGPAPSQSGAPRRALAQAVAGHDRDGRGAPAVRDRDAGVGRARPCAAETPGTTSNGIPARASASASSPPRPKTNGSPPLRRTTVALARASATSRSLISAWGSWRARALADVDQRRRRAGRARGSRWSTRRSWTTASAGASSRWARSVSRSGSPGPAPTR